MDKMLKKLQMAYELEKENKNNRISINVNEYISRKIADLQREFPSMEFEIIEKAQSVVKCNANLFNIIMMNILENACVFSAGCEGRIIIEISSEHDLVHIAVKDHGVGIDPAFIDKI